jgi:hypothetical protein
MRSGGAPSLSMAAADLSMGGTSRLMLNHHSLSLKYSQR